MVTIKIIFTIFKIICLIAVFIFFLYSIDFAIQEKNMPLRSYDSRGWNILSLFYIVYLVIISIITFSNSPYWTWYMIILGFCSILPVISISIDPNDILIENDNAIIKILMAIMILFPLIIQILFGVYSREYNENMIINNKFEYVEISKYTKCSNDASEHFHIDYYDKNNYIKSMKIYPGKTYKDISSIDPKDLSKTGNAAVIITENENKLAYIHKTKKGRIMGPKILYCTEYFYDKYVKNIQ